MRKVYFWIQLCHWLKRKSLFFHVQQKCPRRPLHSPGQSTNVPGVPFVSQVKGSLEELGMWPTTNATCVSRMKRTEGIFFPDKLGWHCLGRNAFSTVEAGLQASKPLWIKGSGKISDQKHLTNITLISVSEISLFKTPLGLIVQPGLLGVCTHFGIFLLFP